MSQSDRPWPAGAQDRADPLVGELLVDLARFAARAGPVRAMLHDCATAVERALPVDAVAVWTLNATGDAVLCQAVTGAPVAEGGFGNTSLEASRLAPSIRGLAAQHFLGQRAGQIDVGDDWAKTQQFVDYQVCPLLVDDRAVGAVAVFGRRPLAPRLIRTLELVAGLLALAIERKRLECELRQAHRMGAVGQLAGGVAHDFNNLLTVIQGYADLILAQVPADETVGGMVREISSASQRATALTRQLLSFSRSSSFEQRVVNLNAVVGSIQSLLRRLIGEDVELVTALHPRPTWVVADPGQLEQIVLNLAVNAREAMPDGGRMTIATAVADEEASPRVVLSVSDTGVGMSSEVQARIFEPFFTTKGPGKGTGLGLAVVQGIVAQAGGRILVESRPGQGTTFQISLPRVEEGAAPHSPAEWSPAALNGHETVLIAEDDESVRALGHQILLRHGYTVLVAADGEEALAVAARHPGPIDVLVTDMVMPRCSGERLAAGLRALRPNLLVLFLSGHGEDRLTAAAGRPGSFYLCKPFHPSALAAKIREVIGRAGAAPARREAAG